MMYDRFHLCFDLTLHMPMDADFASEFVVGNINKESGLKKNSFPITGTVSIYFNINIFKLFFICLCCTSILFSLNVGMHLLNPTKQKKESQITHPSIR